MFNEIFHSSPSHLIMRKCSSCANSHQTIFYKRLTDVSGFEPYDYLKQNWRSEANILNVDFALYRHCIAFWAIPRRFTLAQCRYYACGTGGHAVAIYL
jgi:hypothetical protein